MKKKRSNANGNGMTALFVRFIMIVFIVGTGITIYRFQPSLQLYYESTDIPEVKKEPSVDVGYVTDGVAIFRETAESFQPTTDKVTTHEYYIMYGNHLLPYYYKHPEMKMLEIGLGCDMGYGPGASVKLWKALFPEADLWEAEFDGKCVQKNQDMLLELGLKTLVGDQYSLLGGSSW
mmetsp:Transcript_26553/g.28556  ORF Transcript_26553/g.28556 Transcript_26553/m.28556 type:complete len:177 (+) Transcript_26553:590-1120(+)